MATRTAYAQLTLPELAKRIDPKGDLAVISEVLAQDNEILMDAIFLEANNVFSHKSTKRLALPSGSWRKINYGVATEASQTVEVVDNIGMLESFSQVDTVLVDSAPNPKSFRMQETASFIEGLSQTFATTLIYGNATTDPEQFHGLAPRMGSLAATANVIGSGAAGGTSIYIVQWAPDKVHMVYPRGSKIGLEHEDLGIETVRDSNNLLFRAYMDHFVWKAGLVIRNEKCIARLCNIAATGTSNIFDEDNLIKLLNRMPQRGAGAVIYANETVISQMEIALKDKANVNYTASDGEGLAGGRVLKFRGCPVRKVDKIIITESQIS